MKQEIAVIGLAVKLPGCENFLDFENLVVQGKKPEVALDPVRKQDVHERFGEIEIAEMSYLDRIDLFDNDFFKITKGEAIGMDPVQRLILEQTVLCGYNAGYALEDLKGTNTGLFISNTFSLYELFVDSNLKSNITGLEPGMQVTRLAYELDLRGPALTIDTTCSSSSVAIHTACQNLLDESCDMAFVGGASIGMITKEMLMGSPIYDPSLECKAFDEQGNGTIFGEGVVVLLLKQKEKAVADGNNVLAVISGSAMNHGGRSMSSIVSPSPEAQAQVIEKAWRKAEIKASDIGFVETHGTGTRLGDPIEISGLMRAVQGTDQVSFHLGAVKSQFGHLNGVAGVLGIAKIIAAMRQQTIPALINFEEKNENLPDTGDALCFPMEATRWPANKKYAGVSSFGLSGTNVHQVLEPGLIDLITSEVDQFILSFRANTREVAEQIRKALLLQIESCDAESLIRLVHTVNAIQTKGRYVVTVMASSKEELIRELQIAEIEEEEDKVLLGFISDGSGFDENSFAKLCQTFSLLDEIYQENKKVCTDHAEIDDYLQIISYFHWLKNIGVKPSKFIVNGMGQIIADVLNNKKTVEEGALEVKKYCGDAAFDKNKFVQFVQGLDLKKNLCIAVGDRGIMLKAMNDSGVDCFIQSSFREVFQISKNVVGFQFEKLYKGTRTYPLFIDVFDRKRCWPEVKSLRLEEPVPVVVEEKIVIRDEQTIQQVITEAWEEILGTNDFGIDDDFFEIGGSSLLGLDVQDVINRKLDSEVVYEDVFEYPTIRTMSKFITDLLCKEEEQETESLQTLNVEERDQTYASFVKKAVDEKLGNVDYKCVFLTGVTGYLGAHLLLEILQHTEAVVYCLVRGKNAIDCKNRIRKKLEAYAKDKVINYARIKALNIDLLEDEIPAIEGVDAVFHAAGRVNHYGKFSLSEKMNYQATIKVYQWAKKNKVPFFHHMSTLDVSGTYVAGYEELNYFETDTQIGQEFQGHIYPQTKFMAEEYLMAQDSPEVNVRIYRIGNISGQYETGVFQTNPESNATYLRLKGLMEFGYYCDAIGNMQLNMNPVDYISESIFKLSQLKEVKYPVFHITGPEEFKVEEIIQEMKEQGISFEKLSDQEAFEKFESNLENGSKDMLIFKITSNAKDLPQTLFHYRIEYTNALLEHEGFSWKYDKSRFVKNIIKEQIRTGFFPNKELV